MGLSLSLSLQGSMGATPALTDRALFEAIDDPRPMQEKAERSNVALHNPHDYSYKEISCVTRTKAYY